ncbi:acyl carrier protein [candidate division KSB1 bacterium]|nr:acyl carrier protein [candidate division KSB1 bacterium]MBL7095921.1 acyl carrier protein [candidate division KSB1 bacterium]
MKVDVQVRDFVNENFLFGNTNVTFNNNDSFIEKGIIDSTGVLELVSFVEEKFNFRVNDEEIIPDNLDSITNLTTFIQKKQAENLC